MTENEFKTLVATMKAAYPSPNFLPDVYSRQVWYRMLVDLDYHMAMAALQRHMSVSEHLPTIAAIREGCAKITLGEQKDWSEGWGKALKLVGKYGYTQEEKALAELREFDPVAAKAIQMLGWKTLCESSSDDVSYRSNFRQIYQTAQKRMEEHERIPAPVREMLGGYANNLKMIEGE